MFMVEEYDEMGLFNIPNRSSIEPPVDLEMYRNRIREIELEIQEFEDFIAMDQNKYENLYWPEIQDRQRRIECLKRRMEFLNSDSSIY